MCLEGIGGIHKSACAPLDDAPLPQIHAHRELQNVSLLENGVFSDRTTLSYGELILDLGKPEFNDCYFNEMREV